LIETPIASSNPTVKIADVYTEWDDLMGFLIKIDATGCNREVTCQKDQNGGVRMQLSINWYTQLDRPIFFGRYIIFITTVKRLDTGRIVMNFHSWILRGAYIYTKHDPFLAPMPIFFHVDEGTDTVPLEITIKVMGFPFFFFKDKCTSTIIIHIQP